MAGNPHAPWIPTYNKTGETSSPTLSPTIKMFPYHWYLNLGNEIHLHLFIPIFHALNS